MGTLLGLILNFILNTLYTLVKFAIRIIKDIIFATKLGLPIVCLVVGFFLLKAEIIVVGEFSFLLFCLIFILCLLITVYVWLANINRRIKSSKSYRKELKRQERRIINSRAVKETYIQQPEPEYIEATVIKPQIFRVKQDPQYIMHVYPDRYELFKETKHGLKYIRTDYK